MLRKAAVVVTALFLATPALAAEDAKPKKAKRPALDLRASPRYSFSPAEVMFTAELKDGDDLEELYCPEVEWEWGDGGRSVQEADCDPWVAGAKIERRFTAHHVFNLAGVYTTEVTLRKSGKDLMKRSVQVTVRPGLGDVSSETR